MSGHGGGSGEAATDVASSGGHHLVSRQADVRGPAPTSPARDAAERERLARNLEQYASGAYSGEWVSAEADDSRAAAAALRAGQAQQPVCHVFYETDPRYVRRCLNCGESVSSEDRYAPCVGKPQAIDEDMVERGAEALHDFCRNRVFAPDEWDGVGHGDGIGHEGREMFRKAVRRLLSECLGERK